MKSLTNRMIFDRNRAFKKYITENNDYWPSTNLIETSWLTGNEAHSRYSLFDGLAFTVNDMTIARVLARNEITLQYQQCGGLRGSLQQYDPSYYTNRWTTKLHRGHSHMFFRGCWGPATGRGLHPHGTPKEATNRCRRSSIWYFCSMN